MIGGYKLELSIFTSMDHFLEKISYNKELDIISYTDDSIPNMLLVTSYAPNGDIYTFHCFIIDEPLT